MGLIHLLALAGWLSVAWPIYLHLRRKRKDRVQEIPSLRLFQRTRRKVRKLRLENLVLFASRALVLLALFLIVAQPFLASSRPLPLPELAGEETLARLGLVIDDSLTAWPAEPQGSRLEQARRMGRVLLEALPPDARVVCATTSYPYPTALLTPPEAMAYLDRLTPSPEPGSGRDALRRVAGRLTGTRAALVILSGRDAITWPSVEPLSLPATWADLTPVVLPVWIRSAERPLSSPGGGNADTLVVWLGGDPRHLTGMRLRVESEAPARIHDVTAAEALAGRVVLPVPPAGLLRLSLEAEPEHPWQVWWVEPSRQRTRSRVVIVSAPDRAGRVAGEVLRLALEAARPEAMVERVPMAQTTPALADEATGAAIIVGGAEGGAALESALWALLRRGGTVVAMPPPDGSGMPAGPGGLIPGWTPRPPPPYGPAQVQGGAFADRFDDLALAGLDALVDVPVLTPGFQTSPTPVLMAGDVPVVSALRPPAADGVLWAAGWRIGLDDSSPSLHPLFPLVLGRLTESGAAAPPAPRPGQTADLWTWFGVPNGPGTLETPSGDRLEIRPTPGQPVPLIPTAPGPYTWEDETRRRVRAVNLPRPPADPPRERADLDQAAGPGRLIWTTDPVLASPDEWPFIPRPDTETRPRRLDLGPLALAALLVGMLVESSMLTWRWWR